MTPRVNSNPERRVVSQSAIAREAGVARTTVSLALRGGEGLNAETVNRVMEAAELLGYRPNNLVAAIRSGRTRMVGVMVPPSNSFWADVLHGIHDGLIEQDYVPLALWSEHRIPQMDEALELRQIERLIDWRVDGAILWPWFANLYRTHISDLKKRDLPMVTIDSVLPDSFHADAVLSDEYLGAEAVAGHLLALGHQEILHFAGPIAETWSRDRRSYFTEAIRRAPGVKLHLVELPLSESRLDLIREAMTGLGGVTAIYCATDEIAAEVYKIAASLGRRIPEDLSVMGYGDVDFGSRLNPPLTTVRQRPYRMGKAAAKMVIDRIEAEEKADPHVERLGVDFVARMSTAPVSK
ncbi:MAG: LacI family DNA-binding transcriptional regulator [Luteolibacter sp.]|uniref:LacI family DNA-binding transcriptional regulator n=1 Tax=Luteolibacter sp. TaxID=1962973 RepID=UPI0032643F35